MPLLIDILVKNLHDKFVIYTLPAEIRKYMVIHEKISYWARRRDFFYFSIIPLSVYVTNNIQFKLSVCLSKLRSRIHPGELGVKDSK